MNKEKKHIEVAVVGSSQSGKSALVAALNNWENQQGDTSISWDEHHSHADMDQEDHDVVLQVIDATNLREALQLTPSLIDHQHPLVIVLTHYDLLEQTHHHLNLPLLRELLGVPIAVRNLPDEANLQEIIDMIHTAISSPYDVSPIFHSWEQQDTEAYHAWMEGVLARTLIHPIEDEHTWEERINSWLISPWIGFPVLAVVLSFVFWSTFAIGDPLGEWLQTIIDWGHEQCLAILPDGWLQSLVADGIILGVGSLLTALPNIIILFFFLGVMEDTGYMARVAFLMDQLMHAVGLHGRSFIPLLMGFDCNVPAIIAARDIQNPKNRALTMLMVPFISCSARLPVYILFIDVFFPNHKAWVLASLYLIGLALCFTFAFIMKKTQWFKTSNSDCINELPDFHLPTLRSILGHIWYRISDFLKKISTVVLYASIIIWALEYFPAQDLNHLESSYLAMIGQWIEPLMRPLGMDWRLSVCLLTGLPAKEAIAATFAILYTGEGVDMGLGMVSAYSFMVFTLLYFPCVATIATLRKEINTKWALFSMLNSMIVAWITTWIIYQLGTIIVG